MGIKTALDTVAATYLFQRKMEKGAGHYWNKDPICPMYYSSSLFPPTSAISLRDLGGDSIVVFDSAFYRMGPNSLLLLKNNITAKFVSPKDKTKNAPCNVIGLMRSNPSLISSKTCVDLIESSVKSRDEACFQQVHWISAMLGFGQDFEVLDALLKGCLELGGNAHSNSIAICSQILKNHSVFVPITTLGDVITCLGKSVFSRSVDQLHALSIKMQIKKRYQIFDPLFGAYISARDHVGMDRLKHEAPLGVWDALLGVKGIMLGDELEFWKPNWKRCATAFWDYYKEICRSNYESLYYVKQGIFVELHRKGKPRPDFDTVLALLRSVSAGGFSVRDIVPLHGYTIKTGMYGCSSIRASLIFGYGHHAHIEIAWAVFADRSEISNSLPTWNALMKAYAALGDCGLIDKVFSSEHMWLVTMRS